MRKKRLCAWLLFLLMMASLLPTAALAAGPLTVVRPPVVQDTYTFDGSSEQTVSEGETVYIPATPAKTGEHFTGWNDGNTTLTASSGKTVTAGKATGTTHAYTSQQETAYYVYFMASDAANETEVVASAKVAPDGTVKLPEDYKPENGKVTGWKIKDTDDEFTAETQIKADTVVVPAIEEGCWVTFNTMGGSEVQSQFVTKDSKINLSSLTPSRTGYAFVGWSETANGEKIQNLEYTVTDSKTLYALWEGNTVSYTVVYWGENADDEGYSVLATDSGATAMTGTTVSFDELTARLPSSVEDRNQFVFVRSDSAVISADGSSVVNVYFARNEYTLVFVAAGSWQLICGKEEHTHNIDDCYKLTCTNRDWWHWHNWNCYTLTCTKEEHKHRNSCYSSNSVVATITAKYGAEIASKFNEAPFSTTYNGRAWMDEDKSSYKYALQTLDRMPGCNETFTLYKKSSDVLKTINYYVQKPDTQMDANKWPQGSENFELFKTVNTYFKYATYDEEYHDILGYTRYKASVAGFKNNTKDFDYQNTLDLYYLRKDYTLTFNNYSSPSENKQVQYGASLLDYQGKTPQKPSGFSENAVFMGWYEVPPFQVTASALTYNFDQTMPAKDLILFAYWKEPDIKLTIKTGGDTFEDTVDFNSMLSDTALYKAHQGIAEGSGFLYWVEDESGRPIAIDSALTKDTTIRAVMKSESEQIYTVIYNDGASDSYQYRSSTVAEAKNYGGTTSGFLYWTDGTNNYYPGAEIEITNNDVTLSPVFARYPSVKPDANTLTYHANFDGATPDKAEVTGLKADTNYTVAGYGTISGTMLPEREGYTFDKWNTLANGEGDGYSTGASFSLNTEGGNDLYAQWTIEQYMLIINYKYADGSKAADAYAKTLNYNVTYSVESPTVSGYTPNQLTVSGTMPAENVEVTVTYYENVSSYTVTYNANGGYFGTTEVTTKNETVNSTGSHALNYTDDFTPIHAVVSEEDVIFLGWSSTQWNSIVGFNDAENAAEIADSIITSVNVTENGAYVYAVWGYDSNENEIPDVFEATITYKIENGQWTDKDAKPTGKDPITAAFALYTQQDDHSWKATDKVLRHGNFPIGHQGDVGCTGQGWYRDEETAPTNLVTPNTKVIDAVTGAKTTFTYRYAEKAAETYTVVLHLNGGSYTTAPDGYTSNSDGTYQYSVQASDVIAPAEPAQDSYVLTGWSLTSSVPQTLIGSESKFSELYLQQGGLTTGSKKIDLYAVWEESEPDDPGTILNVLNAHVFKTFQSANSNSTTGTFTATAEVSMIAAPETDALQLEPSDPEPEYQFVGEYSGTVTLSTGSRKNFSFTAEENVALESDTTYMVSVTEDTSNLSSYVTCAQPTVTFTFETNESGEVTCRDYSITNTYTYKWVDDSDDEDTYYFAIEKIDAQDSHTLNGAKFGLYLDGKQIATATSNRSGIAMFRVYESDYRKITAKSNLYYQELTAPEGYVVSNDKIDIEKSDLTTSQTTAEKKAETVRNYRSSTPDLLNGDDHFAYVIGYEDGSVRPNGLISRAETTTIFFRLLKDSVRDGNLLTSNTYTDVPDNYWANTAISTMTGLGIVQGRSSTTFDPQAPITRAEFAAICARFDTGASSGTQTFSDISGHWAEKYIQRAAELGWIKGYADGTFRPDTYITRAEAMTMINRVLNRIPEETSDLLSNMNVWPDCNPSDWFYLAVQEATNSHDFKHKAGNYETWTGMNVDPNWTRYEN